MSKVDYGKKFDEFDTNHNGKLNYDEFKEHIKSLLHTHLSETAIKYLFNAVHKAHEDFITKEEWLATLEKKPLKDVSKEELKETFKKADASGDGKLSKDEIKKVLKEHGCSMTDEAVDEMMKKYDEDKDGKIDVNEFIDGLHEGH